MKGTHIYKYIILLLFVFLLPAQGLATYVLQTEFGQQGVVTTGFDIYSDQAYDLAVQKDGKIVVAGQSDNSADTDVAVVRYNTDGSLDTTFNSDGRATFKLGNGDDGARGVAVADDGSIVLTGYMTNTEGKKQIALLRLTSAGFLDLDFGIGGQTTLAITSFSGEARDVVIDTENRILIGGTLESDSAREAVAARFLSDGSLDTSFGVNGYRRIVSDEDTQAEVIALQSSGAIVLGGVKENATVKTATLMRLDKDGSIDTGFGTDGLAVLSLSGADSFINDMAVLADDSLIATGYSTTDGQKNITTVKVSSAGIFDTTFAQAGESFIDLGSESVAYAVKGKADGSLVITGEAVNGTTRDIVLVHLESDGSQKKTVSLSTLGKNSDQLPAEAADPANYALIATLSEGQPLLTDINGDDDQGRAITALSDGRLLAAGFTGDGTDDDFALVAYSDDTQSGVQENAIGTTAKPYLIVTLSVTNVNRNGAWSGGVISDNPSYYCGSTSADTCLSDVKERGVVYAVVPYPSYKESTSGSSSDANTSSSAEGTTENGVFPGWVTNTSYNYDVVTSGQTSDGSGIGTYGSEITKVTPDVTYYVRAYALLESGDIIYGNQLSFKTDDACFIATAAFGSFLDSHVVVLRQFRDRYLKNSEIGQDFIRLYYSISPRIAEVISQSAFLKFAVRLLLMPLVYFSYFMLYASLQIKIVLLLTGAAFLFRKKLFAKESKPQI